MIAGDEMRQFRFRARVTLDPVESRPAAPRTRARQYQSHTRALMILARPLRSDTGAARLLPAEIWSDNEEPLRPGDHAVVTARVADDRAEAFLDAGQHFILWAGRSVGHGTICRRVFSDYGPS